MSGIFIMALLTFSVTAVLCITALNRWTGADHRYYWLILAGLPISLIVNELVKTPLLTSFATWMGLPLRIGLDVPLWFIVAVWLNAPIFEEAIKILPLVLSGSRAFWRDASSRVWAGLALGMGFGLGEAAYLAHKIAQSPDYNQLPWYVFTGFALERLIVTFTHGLMTAIAMGSAYQGKRNPLLGYLIASALHALINLGPILLGLRLIPASVSSMGSYGAILVAFLIFQKLAHTIRRNSGLAPQEILYFER